MSETEIKNGIYTEDTSAVTILSIDKIISDDIKTKTTGAEYITKTRASELYKPRNNGEENKGNISYVPAQEQKIQFSLNEPYTVMMNGWFVVNPEVSDIPERWTISINGRPMFYSDPDGNISASIIVYTDDIITSTTEYDRYAYFMPCTSELDDWRDEDKKIAADIWKNAKVTDSDGYTSKVDQWLYNTSASNWNATYGETYKSTLSYINGDEAFKADGTDEPHLFYIQTENIKTGYMMLANCSSLSSFNGDLSNLTDGTDMFRYCRSLASFNGDLSSLTNGNSMFRYCKSLESFNGDLSSLTDSTYMFQYCESLASFNGDLSSLTKGLAMFFGCSELAEFNGNLINLTNGKWMFDLCPKLTAFKGDLSKLEYGYQMFARNGLLTFSTPTLKSLTDAEGMFRAVGGGSPHPLQSFTVEDGNMNAVTTGKHMFQACASLQSFTGNLASMTEGTAMFQGCTSLQSFTCGDLGSLTDGTYMFQGCKLDLESVENIADNIKKVSSGTITIGIQASLQGNAALNAALNTIRISKGWTVEVSYN